MDLGQNQLFCLILALLLSLLSSFPLTHLIDDWDLGRDLLPVTWQERATLAASGCSVGSDHSDFSQRKLLLFVSHPPSTPSTMYRSVLRQVGLRVLPLMLFCLLSTLSSLPLPPVSLSCRVDLRRHHRNSRPSRRGWLPSFPKKLKRYVLSVPPFALANTLLGQSDQSRTWQKVLRTCCRRSLIRVSILFRSYRLSAHSKVQWHARSPGSYLGWLCS